MTDQAQVIYINRDLEFSIYLTDAGGAPHVIGAKQYRFRVFAKPGTAVIDLPWGAGVALGDSPGGRIDINGGTIAGLDEALYGSAELVRSDTGADVIGVWPVHLVREGTVPFLPPGAVTIQLPGGISITTNSGFGGADGPAGPAGASSLVAGPVPLLANGGFSQWSYGTGPFNSSRVICDGVRFNKNAGSTHAITRAAGLTQDQEFCLEWGRSVSGTGSGIMLFALENLYQFHGRQVSFAFDAQADGALSIQTRAALNYGDGGSAQTTQGTNTDAIGTGLTTITRLGFAIDLSGKTLGPNSNLTFQIIRPSAQANGVLKIGALRAWIGGADYGMPPVDPGLQRQLLGRRLQVIDTRTINGTTRVYFPVPMRAAPAVSATAGSVANITAHSCDLTHTSAADTVLTLDAEL
jgi:hypothetical protein